MKLANEYSITVIRSDGFYFNYNSDTIKVLAVEGADFPEIEVSKEAKGFGHGDIITGIRKKSRELSITATLKNLKTYTQDRQKIIGFHNSNYRYDVEITYLGITRIAKDCVLSEAHYPTARKYDNPTLSLMFTSPEADLFADSTDKTSFVTSSPLWHVTRHYAAGEKLAFGEIVKTTQKVINYLGSEPAPVTIEIEATGLVNEIDFKINNAKTKIATVLNNADTLIIDTGARTVRKNGTEVPLSEYNPRDLANMVLNYGDNIVEVKSDSTAYTATVNYVGRYGGI